jgi:hypothetical protein
MWKRYEKDAKKCEKDAKKMWEKPQNMWEKCGQKPQKTTKHVKVRELLIYKN